MTKLRNFTRTLNKLGIYSNINLAERATFAAKYGI